MQARFCTRCGRELQEGIPCPCQSADSMGENKLNSFLAGLGFTKSKAEKRTLFENGIKIVPDVVNPTDGEVAIKQYPIATLRSRIKGEYAKGRLQVTNKRVLFRGAGFSYSGRIALQHEFAIEEIAGIEIKKANRFSGLNAFGACYLSLIIALVFTSIFEQFTDKAPTAALVLSLVAAVASAIPFFTVKKHFWLKLCSLSGGLGALFATSALANISASSLLFGLSANVVDFIFPIFILLWIFNLILVCLVPDLALIIRTKGAAEAITIRRKQYPTLFRQCVEYTGFGEVVPEENIEQFIQEIGSLISDIQTFGDGAIERWKD